MAENEKALIDAVAALYDDSPAYAQGLLDGLRIADNAAKRADGHQTEQAEEATQ